MKKLLSHTGFHLSYVVRVLSVSVRLFLQNANNWIKYVEILEFISELLICFGEENEDGEDVQMLLSCDGEGGVK